VVMQRIVGAGGALAALLWLFVPAYGQVPRKAEPGTARSGWDGRPVTHACHADVADVQGLKVALVEHEKVWDRFQEQNSPWCVFRRGVERWAH